MIADLAGRVAVITGAASGIGAALCVGCAEAGMRVVAADIDLPGAAATAGALPEAIAVRVDVAEPDEVERFAATAFERWGSVDLLINNAGVFQGGRTWERTPADWQWTFGVNVFGITNALAAFVPRMLEQDTDGHIVNTASVAAFVSGPASAPYVVSKAAAFAVTEALALDLASVDAKIGASVLVPSAFDTGIARTAAVRPDRYGVDTDPTAAFVAEALASMTAEGLEPAAVVEPVLDAVRNGTFLIPTRDSYRTQLTNRYEALLERRLPGPTIVD